MRDTLGSPDTGAWAGGVMTAADTANLPANMSPHAQNSALAYARTGVPFIQKRQGMSCLTATPLTDSEAILGQYDYVEVSSGIRRHLVTTATKIAVKALGGTFSTLSSSLTSSTPPDFATANSLAFVVNGTDAYKVRGTTVENLGIVAPTVGAMAAADGGAGLHDGEYELRVAFKNTNTGHFSSASATAAATVTVVDKALDWTNVPVSTDPQVGARLLLIREVNTQAQFYIAGTISDNVTTTATTSVLNENLLEVGPTLTNHNPPLSGMKYAAVFKGRLVLADSENIYWSPIEEPESFPPYQFDGIDSTGDPITGLLVHQAGLLVLKDDRTVLITGELGTGDYTITVIDANIGCTNHRTLVSAGGNSYWWSRQGLVKCNGFQVERVGMNTYGDPNDRINAANIVEASAVVHDERGVIYMALPTLGKDRANIILPFNYVLGVMESEFWDPMDCASLGVAIDGNGVMQPTLGNYAGQVFQLWTGNNDGVAADTTYAGSFLSTSGQIGELIDGAASFDQTGAGLIERRLHIFDDDGVCITKDMQVRITSNLASYLTFTPSVSVTNDTNYTYVIGGPNFEFDTPWRDFGDPWLKKRFEYLFVLLKGADYGTTCSIVMSFDDDELNFGGKDRTFTSTTAGARFDEALFDVDVFDIGENVERRYRVGRVGKSWRARFINREANQPFALLYVAAQAAGQTVKA